MLVRNASGAPKNVARTRDQHQQPNSPSAQSPRVPDKRDQNVKKQPGEQQKQPSANLQQPQPGQSQQKQSKWPPTSSNHHKVTFSNPPITSSRSASPTCPSTANPTPPQPLTKWQKLFSAFKKNKATTGPVNQVIHN